MKIKFFLTIFMAVIALHIYSQSKTYFVSPDGNDRASGLTIKDAWKTIERVNQAVFQPGDNILFKSGAIWYGQLKLQGSGTPGKPILMSVYGGKERPIINIGKAEGAGIRLENQSWWIIDNMEVTSGVQPELGIGRQGIVAVARGENQHVEYIVVRNCYIHDIWGQLGGNTEYVDYNSAAILVLIQNPRGSIFNTTLNNVLIEHNRIERVDKCGIVVRGCKNNMHVRNNYMENLGGDGIFCAGTNTNLMYKGMIEYNEVRRSCLRTGYLDLVGGETFWPHTAAIWIQNAEESVMQFNEVYDTGRQPKNGDGFAYDFDFNCVRCTLQYNYSKNNLGGFLLVMNRTFENVTRYNISENDQTHIIQVESDISDRNVFYNNMFYIDYGTADINFIFGNVSGDITKVGASFINNIFYASGQSHFRTVYGIGPVLTRTFDDETKFPTGTPESFFYNNLYFGPWKNGIPDDPKKIVADPLFVAPGSGGNGLSTLYGYILNEGSPAINAGIFIPNNGCRDYFGNPVEDGIPDIGAYEQIGSDVFADKAIEQDMTQVYMTKSRLDYSKRLFPTAIRIPESDGKIVITLRSPLENSITGSITWNDKKTGSKPESILLNKPQQRNDFIFVVKADKNTLLNTSLHVVLQDGDFIEEWDIPFTEIVTPRR